MHTVPHQSAQPGTPKRRLQPSVHGAPQQPGAVGKRCSGGGVSAKEARPNKKKEACSQTHEGLNDPALFKKRETCC